MLINTISKLNNIKTSENIRKTVRYRNGVYKILRSHDLVIESMGSVVGSLFAVNEAG